MSTTADIFYCTLYASWPAPEIGNARYKGKPTPICWREFETVEARKAHQLEAHAAQYVDLDAPWSPPNTIRTQESVKVNEYEGGGRDSAVTPGSRRHVDNAASDAQLALIAKLAVSKGQEAAKVRTKKEASIEIERLMAFPDKGLRPNSYANPCTECRQIVEPNAGFIRKVDGKWLTAHTPGTCPEAAPVPAFVPDGRYAIEAEAGHLSFYRVTNGRKPGVVFMDLLLGGGVAGGFQQEKVPFKSIPTILAKIAAAGPEEAAVLFGQETGVCCSCGRGLTNEASRLAGIGPECAKK